MKHVNAFLPLAAFVLAIAGAFATDTLSQIAYASEIETGNCLEVEVADECSSNNFGAYCTAIVNGQPRHTYENVEDCHYDVTWAALRRP